MVEGNGRTIKDSDYSRELKRGEFKTILLPLMSRSFPDFEFVHYKNQCYLFQRHVAIDQHVVFEGITFCFSLKNKLCECSVESRLNQGYVGTSAYNSGLINPHVDLIALKRKKGAVMAEEAYYYHSGQVKSITDMIQEIINDLEIHGRIFFKEQQSNIRFNNLVKSGLDALNSLTNLPSDLKEAIDHELRNNEHVLSRVTHPAYVEMKEFLQSIKGVPRESRREIPRMAYELLELKMKN